MKIGRNNNWYRPYQVTVNNKWYTVKKIKFYKDGEILVQTDSGWLESTKGDIKEFDLAASEIKLKRKENFDGNVFIISKGKEQYGNEILAELYIPADMLNVHFVRHEIAFKTQVRAIFEGEQGICISVFVKQLNDKLYAIRGEYEEVYRKVSDSCLSVYAVQGSEDILANIDRLKELAKDYITEKNRILMLTIDDIEI